MAYKSSPRGTRPVRLVAIHTAEGARTAASLGAYFYRPDIQASSHVGIDAGATLSYVGYDRASWTLRSGNPISDNAELCAFANFTREQWLGTARVNGCDNPRAILDRTAAWIRERCLARRIPIVKVSPAQVAAGASGVIAHWDWTIGMQDGSHTDPGKNFPWDYVINKANQGTGGGGGGAPAPTPKPEQEIEVALLERIVVPKSPSVTGIQINSLNGSPAARLIVRPPKMNWSTRKTEVPVWQEHVFAFGEGDLGVGHDPLAPGSGFNPKIIRPATIALPGALFCRYQYSCNEEFILEVHG